MVSKGEHIAVEKPVDVLPSNWTYPAVAMEAAARLSPFWLDVANSLAHQDVSCRAGQITYTPDHKAIIGPCSALEGLYLSVGHSGHGVMTAPEAGRILADLIAGTMPEQSNPFALSRFFLRARICPSRT